MGRKRGSRSVPKERCRIIYEAFRMRSCAQDIASFYGMNRTTVCNIVRRLSVTTVPVKQGRPKKLNSFWLTKLEQLIVENRFMPCNLLAATFNMNGTVSIGGAYSSTIHSSTWVFQLPCVGEAILA